MGKPRAAAEEVLRGTEASVGDGGEPAECAEDWNSCAAGKWWRPLPVLLRPLDVATQAGTCFAPVKLDDVRERMPAFVARPRAEDLQEDCTPLAAADSDDDGGARLIVRCVRREADCEEWLWREASCGTMLAEALLAS